MICPECKAEGLKSRVYSGGTFSTLMGYSTYWDEEGVKHTHDPNVRTTSYSCSNDHGWSESFKLPCPAGDYP